MNPCIESRIRCRAILATAIAVAAASAQGQILRVTGSAVQATFTSMNGANVWQSPIVPFTFPGYAWFTYNDGMGTSAGTAITGGFLLRNRGNIASTFIGVPITSYLQEAPAAWGNVATMTLNYSITYQVGALGVAGGIQTGGYLAYGNLAPFAADPGSFAQFSATINYQKVGGPFLGGLAMGTGLINWASPAVNPITGAFSVPVGVAGGVAGFAGPGFFTASGMLQWSVDPATLDIGAQSVPEPSAYAALGVGMIGLLIRRRRAKRS